jgi:ribulose kinase
MNNVSVFGSALALAVALGTFPLAPANADKAAEDAAKAAYEEAKASCDSLSNQAAKVECFKQADEDLKAALQEAMKK